MWCVVNWVLDCFLAVVRTAKQAIAWLLSGGGTSSETSDCYALLLNCPSWKCWLRDVTPRNIIYKQHVSQCVSLAVKGLSHFKSHVWLCRTQLRRSSLPAHFTGHGLPLFSCHHTTHSTYRQVQNIPSCNYENNVSTFSLSIFDCNVFMTKENEEWGGVPSTHDALSSRASVGAASVCFLTKDWVCVNDSIADTWQL